jgi:hypothetical protein
MIRLKGYKGDTPQKVQETQKKILLPFVNVIIVQPGMNVHLRMAQSK